MYFRLRNKPVYPAFRVFQKDNVPIRRISITVFREVQAVNTTFDFRYRQYYDSVFIIASENILLVFTFRDVTYSLIGIPILFATTLFVYFGCPEDVTVSPVGANVCISTLSG